MLGMCKDCRRGHKTDAKGVRKCGIDGKVRASRTVRDCWALLPKCGAVPVATPPSVAMLEHDGDAGQIRLFGDNDSKTPNCESQVRLFSGDYGTEANEITSSRDDSFRLFKD